MKIDKPITIDLTTFLFALTILAILLTPNISIAKKIENSSNSLLFKNTSNILAFNKKDTSQKQDCHCLKDQPKIKLSEITYEDAGRRLKNNPISAYQFFRKKGVPLSKVLPTMIGKVVSLNQFKDLTQYNEKYDAILPNGIPMGLRMWTDVAILNVTKQQQLKQAENGVKGLEKMENYFEKTGEMWAMSMDLGKANWYKRAALQTKKQIDKLKAFIAKLKQLIKEGKTDVKVRPPAIVSFAVVKDYVAVVGNWLIEIDPVRGITMLQIKQTAKVVANGGEGKIIPYTQQQLDQLMESDTFFMGLGADYVTSYGVGMIEAAASQQPIGYVITKEMIGRLFNIDFNSLPLNERVEKIYQLIQNGDISFGLLRGNRLLSVEIHHDGITSSLICYLEPHEDRNADWGYIYQLDASSTHVLKVKDAKTGREYYMLVGDYQPFENADGSTGYGYLVVLLQYNTEEPKNNMPQYASADTNCAACPQFIRLLASAVPVNKAQLKNK